MPGTVTGSFTYTISFNFHVNLPNMSHSIAVLQTITLRLGDGKNLPMLPQPLSDRARIQSRLYAMAHNENCLISALCYFCPTVLVF